MLGLCEAENGTKIYELLQARASEHRGTWKRIQILEDGKVPATEAKHGKIEGHAAHSTGGRAFALDCALLRRDHCEGPWRLTHLLVDGAPAVLLPHSLLCAPRHQLSHVPLLLAFGTGLVVCPRHETTDGAHGSPCALTQPDGAHHTHDCSRAALIVSLSKKCGI